MIQTFLYIPNKNSIRLAFTLRTFQMYQIKKVMADHFFTDFGQSWALDFFIVSMFWPNFLNPQTPKDPKSSDQNPNPTALNPKPGERGWPTFRGPTLWAPLVLGLPLLWIWLLWLLLLVWTSLDHLAPDLPSAGQPKMSLFFFLLPLPFCSFVSLGVVSNFGGV